MRYVAARYQEQQRELAYRIYVTDALRVVTENTAKLGGGAYMKVRYADIVNPIPEDNRTEEEVIAHVLGKLRGIRGEET